MKKSMPLLVTTGKSNFDPKSGMSSCERVLEALGYHWENLGRHKDYPAPNPDGPQFRSLGLSIASWHINPKFYQKFFWGRRALLSITRSTTRSGRTAPRLLRWHPHLGPAGRTQGEEVRHQTRRGGDRRSDDRSGGQSVMPRKIASSYGLSRRLRLADGSSPMATTRRSGSSASSSCGRTNIATMPGR
jgi:hypothetical protein